MSRLNVFEALRQQHDRLSMKLSYLADCALASRQTNLSVFLHELKQAEEQLNSNEHVLWFSDPRKDEIVRGLLQLQPTDPEFTTKILQFKQELESILEEERRAISAKYSGLDNIHQLQSLGQTLGRMSSREVMM